MTEHARVVGPVVLVVALVLAVVAAAVVVVVAAVVVVARGIKILSFERFIRNASLELLALQQIRDFN